MKSFWNERYKSTEYAYGTEPNAFLKENAFYFKPKAKVLFISEGEGRNAVFLAKQGAEVCAFDFSEEGRKKALALARKNQVDISYTLADLQDYSFGDKKWDGIVSIFAHAPSELRLSLYPKIKASLKPGGLFLLEGYTEKQLNYQTGGPADRDLLFSLKELQEAFQSFDILCGREIDRSIEEGLYHKGMSAVVQWIARKSA